MCVLADKTAFFSSMYALCVCAEGVLRVCVCVLYICM